MPPNLFAESKWINKKKVKTQPTFYLTQNYELIKKKNCLLNVKSFYGYTFLSTYECNLNFLTLIRELNEVPSDAIIELHVNYDSTYSL